jgi:hypothetical protein
MNRIVTLDARQEAVLQAAADDFVRQSGGDPVKALKEQMVLNAHLQDRLDALSGELEYPRQAMRR